MDYGIGSRFAWRTRLCAVALASAASGCELDSLVHDVYPPDAGETVAPSQTGSAAGSAAPAAGRGGKRPGSPAAGTGGARPCGHSCDPRVEPDGYDAGVAPEPSTGPARAADVFGLTSQRRLLGLDSASGEVRFSRDVSGLHDGELLLGADIRPADGQLYALTSHARLFTLDLTTGAASLIATLTADPADMTDPFRALSGARFGVDFNPVADRLRVVSDLGQNLRIQVTTGATTTDGAINPTAALTAAAYTNSFASACRTRLLVIDSDARTLSLQDPPNNGTLMPLGSLGQSAFDQVTAFEIQTRSDGSNRGVIAVAGSTGSQLLDVALDSGAVSQPRSLALEAGESLVALSSAPPMAAPVQAPGELVGLSVSNRLVSFNRAAPGKLCTSSDITGLGDSEQVLGIDVRPANGMLYALSSAAKLYTLDVASGAAKLAVSLVPDSVDTTDPFSGLSGSAFALGWNPVPDRLRVMSDTGQNLRVQVATGETITDAPLSGAARGVTAAAYTNAFAGSKSTTLFALDTHADALVRVGGDPASAGACGPDADAGNPNCGVVTALGSLGLGDVSDINGFDIDAKTGTALCALSSAGATSSTLYTLDLGSGAASLPMGVANGTIGGGELLRGLTLLGNPVLRATLLTSDAQLMTVAPAMPMQPGVRVPVSGLYDGESLLGIDVRPADSKLYGLGSAGRLYTLDRTTGQASLVSVLAAASGDDAPFTGFELCDFGVDFNPVADLLRAVNAAGDNFRVAPSARNLIRLGDTFTDAQLNPDMPNVVAAAYTNNFVSAPSTTLYVIDTASDMLALQGGVNGTPSPNTGTLTGVGKLGVDAEGDAAFDIVGGHNGLALATLQVAGAPAALYSVQLGSGAASPFAAGDIQLGAVTVKGLALELK